VREGGPNALSGLGVPLSFDSVGRSSGEALQQRAFDASHGCIGGTRVKSPPSLD
jgi:hypothetical protein